MSEINRDNKRLAKNTAILYVRMIFSMALSLYTSRLILSFLGVVDFGVYNVVGGVVTFMSIISAAFSGSCQRFLSICIGRGDYKATRRYFLTILNAHMLLAIVLLLLSEISAYWIINCYLKIPSERLMSAHITYQLSLFATVISLINVPYFSLILSYEEMSIYAYVSIGEQLLRLIGILLLFYLPLSDNLIAFSILVFFISCVVRLCYTKYCKTKYTEIVEYRLYLNKSIFSEIWKFVSWAYLGNLAGILKEQGVNIVIGHWFGVTVNAARAIAVQVYNALNSFGINFLSALRPQITKNFACGNFNRAFLLTAKGSKYAFILLYIIVMPFYVISEEVLKLWLKNVPEGAVIFTKLTLILCFFRCVSDPLSTLYLAQGKIKESQIFSATTSLLCVILASAIFSIGAPAYYSVLLTCFFELLNFISLLFFLKYRICFSILLFVKEAVVPIFFILLSTILPVLLLKTCYDYFYVIPFVVRCFVTMFWCLTMSYYIGLSTNEKTIVKCKLIDFVKYKINV